MRWAMWGGLNVPPRTPLRPFIGSATRFHGWPTAPRFERPLHFAGRRSFRKLIVQNALHLRGLIETPPLAVRPRQEGVRRRQPVTIGEVADHARQVELGAIVNFVVEIELSVDVGLLGQLVAQLGTSLLRLLFEGASR